MKNYLLIKISNIRDRKNENNATMSVETKLQNNIFFNELVNVPEDEASE